MVEPARCGVTTTCSSSRSGPEYGSSSNTSSAAPATFPERIGVGERLLVDQPAASRVHDANAVAHPRERRRVEQPPRLLVQRKVERDEVGLAIDVLGRRRGLDSELAEAVERHVRVVGEDAQPEPERPPRDLTADAPQPEDAERLPRELDARRSAPRSQRPCLSAAWAWGTFRATASSSASVCSAAETTVASGAFATTIPASSPRRRRRCRRRPPPARSP